jgi:hypothetical protein
MALKTDRYAIHKSKQTGAEPAVSEVNSSLSAWVRTRTIELKREIVKHQSDEDRLKYLITHDSLTQLPRPCSQNVLHVRDCWLSFYG